MKKGSAVTFWSSSNEVPESPDAVLANYARDYEAALPVRPHVTGGKKKIAVNDVNFLHFTCQKKEDIITDSSYMMLNLNLY